jgi:hypothetical protein
MESDGKRKRRINTLPIGPKQVVLVVEVPVSSLFQTAPSLRDQQSTQFDDD